MNARSSIVLAGLLAAALAARPAAAQQSLQAPPGSAEHGAHEVEDRGHAAHDHAGAAGEAGEHGEDQAAAHGGGEHHGPEPINWFDFSAPPRRDVHGVEHPAPKPFVATLINFAILLVLLYMALKRAINPALASRRAAIESEMAEAQRLRAEAEALHREYTERLTRLEDEIAAMRADFIQTGERERERIVAEARARAERMRRDGEFVIQQEVKQLRSDLMHEAVEAAVTAAERAVRAGADANDQARLADGYLAELEKQAGATPAAGGAA